MNNNQIIEIFCCPLLISQYKNSLVDEINFLNTLEYEVNGDNNNYKSKDTYILKNKNLEKINSFIQNSLYEYKDMLNAKQSFYITQSWINKNPVNSKHHEHVHPNSFISGVFYFRLNEKHPPIQKLNLTC